MGLEFADSLANARADLITAARDAGASEGKIRIYDGTRPAKGGSTTTLLAELTFSAVSAPAASGGIVTANVIAGDPSARASGTATWFREVDGDGVFVMDGDIGTSGSDLNVNDVNFVAGLPVSINSYVTTEGNL